MASLVNTTFLEWTHGLDSCQSLISVFKNIRDIPYSLAFPMTDPRTAPERILELGRGSCGPKHYLLAEMFRRLGFKVIYATIPFLWNDPDTQYPPEIRQLAASLPVVHHLTCRVQINGCWVLVDATWDLALKRVGFPVNEHWDGKSETRCAVKPLRSAIRTAFCRRATSEPFRSGREEKFYILDGEQNHREAGDRARYYHEMTALRTPEEITRICQFNREFEAWLVSVRE